MSEKTLFLKVVDENDPEKGLVLKRVKIEMGNYLKKDLKIGGEENTEKEIKIIRPYLDIEAPGCKFVIFEIEQDGQRRLVPYLFEDSDPVIVPWVRSDEDEVKLLVLEKEGLFGPKSLTLPRESNKKDWSELAESEKNRKKKDAKEDESYTLKTGGKRVFTRIKGGGEIITETEIDEKSIKKDHKPITMAEVRERFMSGEINDPLFAAVCLRHIIKKNPEIFSENEELIIHP
jgi:hypothetical protein